MIELPDVNVLLALNLPRRHSHLAAADWLQEVEAFATTPVTEMGLVRQLLNPAVMKNEVIKASRAIAVLEAIKRQPHYTFWPDVFPFDLGRFNYALTGHAQVTDLHLLDIAAQKGGRLATFDQKLRAALRPSDRKFIHLLE
ncbi:MAG: hypothetical protein FWG25_06325 [Promicromonosporaceae bacterium]|nr:hypothetical protein [Promicromonosporaceae bacterium]